MGSIPVVTRNLLIINVLAFLASEVLGMNSSDSNNILALHFFLAKDFLHVEPGDKGHHQCHGKHHGHIEQIGDGLHRVIVAMMKQSIPFHGKAWFSHIPDCSVHGRTSAGALAA